MKVLITHAYSTENKGDAALLDVLISDIRRQYGARSDISILTIDTVKKGERFAGVPLYPAFMYHALHASKAKIAKLVYSFILMTYTLAWAQVKKRIHIELPMPSKWRATANLYLSADLIITVGGGYFRSSADPVTFVNLLLMLHPLRFAQILSKPTCLYTMSVGPFSRSFEEKIVAKIFKKTALILVREDTSLDLLRRIGVADNIVRSVDSGFLFSSNRRINLRKKLGVKKSAMLVGVTARQWLAGDAQDAYEAELANALDEITKTYDAHIVFIPQVTSVANNDDDRIVSHRVAKKMKNTKSVHVMDGDYDLYDVKAMYNELDFIIGTRFHSVIFSLTSRVPAIAIEYEHKTSGIMRDLKLSNWTLKIEDVKTKKIVALFDKLIQQRKVYIDQLNTILPDYIAQAKDAIVLVDKAYSASVAHGSSSGETERDT